MGMMKQRVTGSKGECEREREKERERESDTLTILLVDLHHVLYVHLDSLDPFRKNGSYGCHVLLLGIDFC